MNRISHAPRVTELWLVVAALICLLASSQAKAADLSTIQLNRELGISATRYIATDKAIAFRLVYIGTAAPGASGPTVAVSAGGDLAFTTDGTTADTGISTDGTIDLSTPAAGEDTFGEVADVINASTNWRCVLVDLLPSQSTDNVLSTLAETSGTTGKSATYNLDGKSIYSPEGLAVTYNTADVDYIAADIGPEYTITEQLSTKNLLNRRAHPSTSGASYWRAQLNYVKAVATFTTGAPDVEVWLVDGAGAGATEIKLWSQVGAATTVAATLDLTDLPPIMCKRGQRLLVRYMDNTTPDVTAATLQVHGLIWEE